jgi:hypothetical protein
MPDRFVASICSIGNLVEHYYDHRHEQANLSFIGFLSDHYLDHQHHDDDHENHEDLPFHNHHDDCYPVAQSVFVLPHDDNTTEETIPTLTTSLNTRPQQWHSIMFTGDIWQPPKA